MSVLSLSAVRRAWFILIAVLLCVCAESVLSADASARAGWELDAVSRPTYLRPGGRGALMIRPVNVGSSGSEGMVTVTDVLPPGFTATTVGAYHAVQEVGPEEAQPVLGPPYAEEEVWNCSGDGPGGGVAEAHIVTCVNNPSLLTSLTGGGGTPTAPASPGGFTAEYADPEIAIGVKAPPVLGTAAEPNRVTIAGGGAPSVASTHDPITVSSTPAPFGITHADAWFSNEDGTIDTQAGSHPYESTVVVDFNTLIDKEGFPTVRTVDGQPRNLTFNLPPGFVGDPTAVQRCTRAQFLAEICPAASQVGIIAVEGWGQALFDSNVAPNASPVYNLVPPEGQPAELGFIVATEVPTFISTAVRSGGNYSLTSQTNNIAQEDVAGAVLTLWGEPGNASHNHYRANHGPINAPEAPFLTLPTSCAGPQEFSASVNSWEDPAEVSRTSFSTHDANDEPAGFTGCEHLGFGPQITTSPDTVKSDTPAGVTVEVKSPVGGLEDPEGLSASDIQNTTVALPAGFVINPGQAAGLQSCPPGRPSFTPGHETYGDGLTTEEEKARGEEDDGPAHCPGASKVGVVEIETPLLPHSLKGAVYVLQSNPPELELLVTAEGEGVFLKLVGVVHLDEQTGQLTTKFEGTPELPFTDFKLSFSGGAQAALDTPAQCGTYTTTSEFVPWSNVPGSSQNFISDAFPAAAFSLTEGPGGGSCPSSPLPFNPSLTAGSTTDQAGGFTNFSLLLERGDGQQRIERLQFRAPAGLAGLISQVPLCPEPQAAAGMCPEASKIGHATVASGPGPYPLVIPQPGEPESPIYLTGPYQGAPFGLSIVTHVLAGPFNLGTIVTRARIEIDPHTAQITVTTDPLPQVVDGVPTDLRLINSVIDRPGFMFNPTNCSSQAFSGTAYGTPPPSEGGPHAQAAISSHFGVGSCRELGFSPDFKASTSGKTSKAKGASLDVKVQYPSTPAGSGRVTSQANIASVKVELPKQLPSRLTTLQKACTAAQFASNPAGCPAASIVGHAIVHTPVLPVPLEGPAYFVSNGGEAFPNLIMVLQGYDVTVELVGDTFINKQGITSSTFKSTPDVPFSSFELNLPEGPYSALAANTNLCATMKTKTVKKRVTVRKRGRTVHLLRSVTELVPTLSMPTTIVGQNGAEIHQDTKIEVSGCSRHKAVKKAKKRRGKARKARK